MFTNATMTRPTASLIQRVWQHPLLAPFNQASQWDRLLQHLNPLWSMREPRARVVRLVDEAGQVKSIWLKPNSRFKGFEPGQHILLSVEIHGVRQQRCFSLSHAPRADGLLRLTIKRKEFGPVSSAAHQLKIGQIVGISQAMGTFAPRQNGQKLLLLSAGSGLTPMASHLHALVNSNSNVDVVLLHSDRSAADMIFLGELRGLVANLPSMRIHRHTTAADGRLTPARIEQQVPDWRERETLLCGPDDFMRMVETMYAQNDCLDQLTSESFGRRVAAIDPTATSHSIHATKNEQMFTASVGQSLLDAAEAAGLAPKFGCRRGICRTCQCLKHSGSVRNLLTGQTSSLPMELIQLCISSPLSDVELAL
jgi:stearoyl-CoA 9-desaturase NADPH oxidoreductase